MHTLLKACSATMQVKANVQNCVFIVKNHHFLHLNNVGTHLYPTFLCHIMQQFGFYAVFNTTPKYCTVHSGLCAKIQAEKII